MWTTECNNILAGVPRYPLDWIQSLLNIAASLIYGCSPYDHVLNYIGSVNVRELLSYAGFWCIHRYTSLHVYSLHWWRRHTLPNCASRRQQLSVILEWVLKIHNDLVDSRTALKFSGHSLAVAVPTVWNNLPQSIRDSKSVDIFKSKLKINLFGLSLESWCT